MPNWGHLCQEFSRKARSCCNTPHQARPSKGPSIPHCPLLHSACSSALFHLPPLSWSPCATLVKLALPSALPSMWWVRALADRLQKWHKHTFQHVRNWTDYLCLNRLAQIIYALTFHSPDCAVLLCKFKTLTVQMDGGSIVPAFWHIWIELLVMY